MKKTLLLLSALFMSFGAFAQVEFKFADLYGTSTISDITEQPKTIDNVTVSFAKGNSNNTPAFNKAGEVRLYGGKSTTLLDGCTMTFTSEAGNIATIVLAHGSDCTWGTLTASVGTIEESESHDITWTGDAAEVTFTASRNADATNTSTQNRYTTATVTLSGTPAKETAGLAWSETKVSVEQGTEFTAPTFTKTTDATVTFTSDNEEVATVSEEGVITLTGELGTATITATSPETDNYYAGEATVTIEVFKYNTYKKATELVEGKEYLLVAQRDDATYYAYPLSENKTYGYLSTGKVDELTDEVKVKSTYNDAFHFTASGTGYAMQDYLGRYYYQEGTYKSFQVSSEAPTTTWSVDPQEDGTFKFSMNGMYVQFGEGTYTSFGIYDEAKENAVLPYLYELYVEPEAVTKPENIPFDLTEKGGWPANGETFEWDSDIDWTKQALEIVVDLSTCQLSAGDENIVSIAGSKADLANWGASDAAGHIHFYYNGSYMETNYLTTSGNIYRNKSYSLFSNTEDNVMHISRDGVKVNGNLWEGAAEQTTSYTAFDAETIEPLTALSHIWVGDTQGNASYATYKRIQVVDYVTTGISNVETEQSENAAQYNLAGQRVGKDYKGIVIVNGKKLVRK